MPLQPVAILFTTLLSFFAVLRSHTTNFFIFRKFCGLARTAVVSRQLDFKKVFLFIFFSSVLTGIGFLPLLRLLLFDGRVEVEVFVKFA